MVVEEPVEFPEGTELELTIADPGDDLDEGERAALHAALDRAWESAKAGKGRPAEDLIRELRSRKCAVPSSSEGLRRLDLLDDCGEQGKSVEHNGPCPHLLAPLVV